VFALRSQRLSPETAPLEGAMGVFRFVLALQASPLPRVCPRPRKTRRSRSSSPLSNHSGGFFSTIVAIGPAVTRDWHASGEVLTALLFARAPPRHEARPRSGSAAGNKRGPKAGDIDPKTGWPADENCWAVTERPPHVEVYN